MPIKNFAWFRLKAILYKEIVELSRDKITMLSLLVIPILQIFLGGLIINTDPKHVSSAIYSEDQSPFVRSIISGLENTKYFDFKYKVKNEAEANKLLATGKIKFALFIPYNFSRDLILERHPKILLKADSTNPLTVANGLEAAKNLEPNILTLDLKKMNINGGSPPPFEFVVNHLYNPESVPQFFTVPGVIGITLSLSLLLMTLISIATEKSSGTMENLLTTPIRPVEVVMGKIAPFVVVGYFHFIISLLLACWYFDIPMQGSVVLLLLCIFPFIISCITLGLFISGIATSQFQAVQVANMYFIPNFLFSGFVFPFQGMPVWAQWIGNCMPLTHFLRLINGIMLKCNNMYEVLPYFVPLLIFMSMIIFVSVVTYKKTLD